MFIMCNLVVVCLYMKWFWYKYPFPKILFRFVLKLQRNDWYFLIACIGNSSVGYWRLLNHQLPISKISICLHSRERWKKTQNVNRLPLGVLSEEKLVMWIGHYIISVFCYSPSSFYKRRSGTDWGTNIFSVDN